MKTFSITFQETVEKNWTHTHQHNWTTDSENKREQQK